VESSAKLRYKLILALLVLMITFALFSASTFAWYIYNTAAHTTKLHMAAGSSTSLEISNSYEGPYASSAVLESFTGMLDPVSTNRITNGFQKVVGFENGASGQPSLLASLFGDTVENVEYFKTQLFVRSIGNNTGLYISGIDFDDEDMANPISSALRIGFVVHAQGYNQPAEYEYIFALSDVKNPQRQYNTLTGKEGYVLDSTKKNGATVPFEPYTAINFVNYDSETGTVSLREESVKLCDIEGSKSSEPVEVSIYIWLEGCDEDCVSNISGKSLDSLALSFSGY